MLLGDVGGDGCKVHLDKKRPQFKQTHFCDEVAVPASGAACAI